MSSRLFAIDDALDSDAWYTPAWLFEGMGIVFDLDVCSPAEPPPWIPARERLTVSDDGLLTPWHGVVWCNPPYSAPAPWCFKWASHGNGCLLIRSDLSTSGPVVAFGAATSIYVAPKRIQFVNGHGASMGSVAFSTVLLGVGPVADAGLARLASASGGHAKRLAPSHK